MCCVYVLRVCAVCICCVYVLCVRAVCVCVCVCVLCVYAACMCCVCAAEVQGRKSKQQKHKAEAQNKNTQQEHKPKAHSKKQKDKVVKIACNTNGAGGLAGGQASTVLFGLNYFRQKEDDFFAATQPPRCLAAMYKAVRQLQRFRHKIIFIG